MSVHYKFKSNLDYDTVTFDGLHISVADLKKSIMQQKKIGKSSDFDLQITNAQTKEVYDNEEILVPKNTSVIVARVPVATGNKKTWERPDLPLPLDDGESSGQIRFDKLVRNADLINCNASEEDKVKAMITQSSQEYDPSKYVKSRSMTGPLPPTYTCYRCGKQGHWIKNCPTNNLDIKRSTGIPRSFMVPVDGPEHKGALLTSSGDYAVPLIDHQAYKEVKKEKPPFITDNEPEVEAEAQIPEELLCMVCRDLLQEAVLIPCCGNSFCDECVRQVLLDSDNHECPLCHETGISPDTVIPNRFLRTAVLNFRNETGYTRVKKFSQIISQFPHIESPQPSPDSTVENQPAPLDSAEAEDESQGIKEANQEEEHLESEVVPESEVVLESEVVTECEAVPDSEAVTECEAVPESEAVSEIQTVPESEVTLESEAVPESETVIPENTVVTTEDVQPGTPLADEPPADIMAQPLPIETVGHGHYEEGPDYRPSMYAHQTHDNYDQDSRDGHLSTSEHGHISTIETITNIRKAKYMPPRLPPPRQHFPPPRQHHERPENYDVRERSEYRRYDRRRIEERPPDRGVQRPHSRYDRPPRDSRYHRSDNRHDYHEYSEREHIPEIQYEPPPMEQVQVRRPNRYNSSPPANVHPQHTIEIEAAPSYSAPPITHQQAPLLSTPQPFPPQPPPPGASPVDNSSHVPPQPPPPGVGPLLPAPPPVLGDGATNYGTQSFESEDSKPQAAKTEERSIDDRLEAFQRELEKRDRESARDRSRSSTRSRDRDRSRTSSRSRTYSSSKSWSRSQSRSISRSSRSRSRTPYSSRSRSRSYSRSRSRSRSKSRSYTRSRTRSRTKSRSRSRDRHRPNSRERTRTPVVRNHSASPSSKVFVPRNRRSPYQIKRVYNAPQYGGSYPPPYAPPAALVPIPMMRPPLYPSSHIHSVHAIQPVHPHPIDHYPIERPRYSSYNDQYSGYDMYQQPPKPYNHQRYDREQRNARFDKQPQDYQKDYQRRGEEVQHRIPGWVGDRGREYKPRFRGPRDQQRKEIKELPKLPEPEIKSVRVKEPKEEIVVKKKEEKQPIKHKKHHHHRSKEVKKQDKQENKIPVLIGVEKVTQPPANLIKVEVLSEKAIETKKSSDIQTTKAIEKAKEKKHKHRKHKVGEQVVKKKKTIKKEKPEAVVSSNLDSNGKVKTKKRKSKTKTPVDGKKKQEKPSSKRSKVVIETLQAEINKTDAIVVNKVIKLEDSTLTVPLEKHSRDTKTTVDVAENDKELATNEFPPQTDSEIQEGIVTANIDEVADKVENISEYVEENNPNSEEGEVEGEDELHVDLPVLSKWEREDFEEEIISRPQRKSAVVVPREERESLSSDIIQRAEKAILHKVLKTAIVINPNKEKCIHKSEKKVSNKLENLQSSQTTDEVACTKHKEQNEIKSVVSAECAKSPTLQVTITADKDKRSVHTKRNAEKEHSRDESQQSKKIKLDRSKFSVKSSETVVTSNVQRTITIAESSDLSTKYEDKRKSSSTNQRVETKRERTKITSLERENVDVKNTSRERKDVNRTVERDRINFPRDRSRDEKRRKYNVAERSTRDESFHYSADRGDRNKRMPYEHNVQGRDKRFPDNRDSFRGFERPPRDSYNRRSRSRSFDSTDSYPSNDKKRSRRQHNWSHHSQSSSRQDTADSGEYRQRASNENSSQPKKIATSRLHVKNEPNREADRRKSQPKQFPQDELKFEPNYDEFSEEEVNCKSVVEEKNKPKRAIEVAENSRKRAKHEHVESSVSSTTHDLDDKKHRSEKEKDKSSVTSSPSSSAVSESDSSDPDNPRVNRSKNSDTDIKQRHKKNKHKKHKKHKHKHKRKKSHRSRLQ